jgi:hypothetical protein
VIKILSSTMTWIIVALVGIVGLLAAVVFGVFDTGGPSGPSPSGSVSPTPGESHGGGDLSGVVSRPVTTGAHIPSAEPLTPDVLGAEGSGWVVAIDDTTATNTASGITTPGPKLLYMISPDGTRYELANLDTLGFSTPNLVAWNDARDTLLLSDTPASIKVYDIPTNTVTSSWSYCADPGYVGSGEARDDNWLIRLGCNGTPLDNLFTDAGAVVPGSGVITPVPMAVAYDVGDVQVTSEFEVPPDGRFVAHYADGTSAILPSSMAGDCYLLGKGWGSTVAGYCFTDTATPSIWEFPVDGTSPYEVISEGQMNDFGAAAWAAGPGDFYASGYCADSALRIVQAIRDDDKRLGVLYAGTVEPVGQVPFRYRVCHATQGTAALVSGDGHLWWEDFDTGTDITLLPGESAGSSIQVIGSDNTRALRLP